MARLNLVLICLVCTGIAFAQDDLLEQEKGGTVRGQIVDITEMQAPIAGVEVVIVAMDGTEFTTTTDANGDYVHTGIPAGRYLINISKKGYTERIGRPVTVVNGGDHYLPLKMTKRDNILTFFQSSVPMYWVLILGVIIVVLILGRANR